MTDMWGDLVWAALRNLGDRLSLVLPGILAMLTLAAIGLALAWIIARVVRRVAQALTFDRRAEAWGLVAALGRAGIRRAPSHAAAAIVFWSIFILFLTVAVGVLTASPAAAFGIAVLFGLVRGLTVFLTAKVDTPAQLVAFHRRFDAWGEPTRRSVVSR